VNDEEYCRGWRQARVFTRKASQDWYPELLAAVVVPFASDFPDHPFFFSMYACPVGMDDGDTEIGQLPAEFKIRVVDADWHFSIRLRFREGQDAEARLADLVDGDADLWYSESGGALRPYAFLDDIGGPRFCPDQDAAARNRRARLVAEALKANNLIVLDAIVRGSQLRFERNNHPENAPNWSTFLSLGHMFNNVWKDYRGMDLGISVVIQNHVGQHVIVRRL